MKISRIGGIIAAASKKVAQPLMQVGAISVIRRIVITYRQVGIFPIVVITGVEEEEVVRQLKSFGVIFLQNTNSEQPELLESVRIGMEFLKGRCERVAFTPVNVPMFTPSTLSRLIKKEGDVVAPSYYGKGGHPVLLSDRIIPELMTYNGTDGLRGAIESCSAARTWVDVEDRGVITNVYNKDELREQLKYHNHSILHPVLHMELEMETSFFSERLKTLLFLLDKTQNMRVSCEYSGIAHSRAWDMINQLEQNLGYQVVLRQRGGKDGGCTKLTEKGLYFLRAYQNFEERIYEITQEEFENRLISTKIID